MSDQKKYSADDPVTWGELFDVFKPGKEIMSCGSRIMGKFHLTDPEPKDGELWLCRLKNSSSDIIALWRFSDGWGIYKSGLCAKWVDSEVEPLQRLLPAEDEG